MWTPPFSTVGNDLHELESRINEKADKYEISSLRSDVDRLERSLQETSSEVDELRVELQAAQSQIVNLIAMVAELKGEGL